MSDALRPKPVESGEPFAQRWGLWGGGCLLVPIGTSISEGGVGGCAQLGLDIAESFEERYALQFQFDYAATDAKLLPTVDSAGTAADREHYGYLLGIGRTTRLAPWYGRDRSLAGALSFGTTPLMGAGTTLIGGGSRELGGESFDFGTSEATTFDVKTNYSLLGEFRPWGRGPTILAGPEFAYGVQFAGAGSEHNRVGLEFGFTLRLGYGDASTLSGGDVDSELGAMAIAQGAFALIQGWMQRYAMNQTLADAQEALAPYLSDDGEGGRGALENLPLLQMTASLLGGLGGGGLTTPLRAGTGWYWGFLAARAVGGAGFLFSEGDAGVSGGIGDLCSVARLAGYAFAGIETSSKRLALADAKVRDREAYVNLGAFGLNTLLTLIGGLAGSGALASAGVSSNVQIGASPDPAERSLVASTQAGFAPYAVVGGLSTFGDEAYYGVRIHQSWRNPFDLEHVDLFTAIDAFSPYDPSASSAPPSYLAATTGIEGKWTYGKIGVGLSTLGIFGGGKDHQAGIGGTLNLDLTIPVSKNWKITAGADVSAYKLFPKGELFSLLPSVGVEIALP